MRLLTAQIYCAGLCSKKKKHRAISGSVVTHLDE